MQSQRLGSSVALPFVPVVDGVALPKAPLSAISPVPVLRVALMAGTNLDEMTFFSIGDRGAFGMAHDRLLRRVTRLFGDADEATAIIDAYRGRPEPTTAQASRQPIYGWRYN